MVTFERRSHRALGNRNIAGLTLDKSTTKGGYGYYQADGINVIEVVRLGNNRGTAGGATTVGYHLEGQEDGIQKSIKKLVQSL